MISGQRAKPVALHVIQGTDKHMGKSARARLNTVARPTPGVASPPDAFNDKQRAIWTRLVEDCPAGLLTRVDYDAVVNYVVLTHARDEALALYVQTGCQVVVRTTDGHNRMVTNPLMRELRRCIEQMRTLQCELGLTPSARARISIPETPAADELAAFLG